tara:strand:- start:1436 stop:1864 length:429 start_codon:yes stop_codon:yes gene_type:complete
VAYSTSSTASASASSTGTTTGSAVNKSANGLTSDQKVNKVFDQYFTGSQNFPSNEVDAVVGFFENRGFEKTAAISTATTLLSQARLDSVNVFELLDTLKGLEAIQLSAVVAQVINYNRPSTSTIGFRRDSQENLTEKRNILI